MNARDELRKFLGNSPDVGLADDGPEVEYVERQHRVLHMKPYGKARPRVTANGTYMPPAYQRRRRHLQELFGEVRVKGKLAVTVTAVRRMPLSWSKKRRDRERGKHHTHTPDVDNIAGAVMDALLPDDSYVVAVECNKIWGDEDQLEVTIESVEET